MTKKHFIAGSVRRMVAERADWRCEYCLSPENLAPQCFTLEHIVPLSKGGSDEPENLAYACQGCNGSKYAKTEALDPITKMLVPLFDPRTQNWTDHFSWGKISTIVLGTTPTGRATVLALKLNRKKLIILREVLVFFGTHPPEIGKD